MIKQIFIQLQIMINSNKPSLTQGTSTELSTNNTLKFKQGTKNTIFYLPVYTRLIVKSISKLSYQEMTANVNVQILITIKYEGINDQLKWELLTKGIRLSFDKDENILLKDQNKDVSLQDESQKRLLHFTVRKFVGTILDCQVRWAPFEKLTSIMSIVFNKVLLPANAEHSENIEFHFNLMDNKNQKLKISSSNDSNFGLFEVITSGLSASYGQSHSHHHAIDNLPKDPKDEEKVALKQEERQLKTKKKKTSRKQIPLAFNSAHFRVPLFKNPTVGVVTIFLPLLLLSIINLGIFFQEVDLHNRIVSIAAIMVSFVALVPVIRDQIPPTPTITVVEGLVLIQALTTILALIESLIVDQKPNYVFIWHQNALFMLAMILTILVNIFIGTLLIIHECVWVPRYRNLGNLQQEKGDIMDEIKPNHWKNQNCDKKFFKYFKLKIVEIAKDEGYRAGLMLKNILGLSVVNRQVDLEYQIKKKQSQPMESDSQPDSQQQIVNLGYLKFL